MAAQRLDKIIASTGRWSRREVKDLVRQGRVTVDDVPARSVEEKADPEQAVIAVNGEKLNWRRYTWVMLNKPAGYLSATEDGRGATVLDLLPKAARVQLVSVSADTARTLAGLDGVSRTYQESLSEYEPAGDTVLIVTDTQTLAAIGTENYTVLRDYGDVYWDVRMNVNDLTENFTTDFILPEAPRYGVGRNNK